MKTRIWIGLLAAAMLLIGLPAAAQAPNSDCFTLFKDGVFNQQVCAPEGGAEGVAVFVFGTGFANTNPDVVASPTVLLEADGSISDIFGVFIAPENGQCQNGCIFFISDAEAALFVGSFPNAILLHEGDGGPFPATRYLDPGKQRIGFTATFQSDDGSVSQIPEPATLALLGLGVLAIGFTRRKSLRTTPR